MKLSLMVFCVMLSLFCMPAAVNADLVFSEDFESPVVSGYAEGTSPSGWVRANQGFGSGRHGLDNKDGGDFVAPAGNDQVYAFRYTNSGLTTDVGAIGTLETNETYVVTFDVVMDGGGGNGTSYRVQLIAFAEGAARNDCRSTPAGSTMLIERNGNAQSDGSWETVSFSFRAGTGHADLGKDLAIRLLGATTSASIDNVRVFKGSLYWDINDSTAGAGSATPSGTWDATTMNWNPLAAGTDPAMTWASGAVATFAAGTDATGIYTVTIDGTQDISGLILEEGTVSLAAGTDPTLLLTTNSTVMVGDGLTLSVAAPFTDGTNDMTLTKLGAGRLTVSGNNTNLTGGVTVEEGVVQFDTDTSVFGTNRNITVEPSGVVLFGSGFGAGNMPGALAKITTSSGGAIAADNYATTDFDFNAAGLASAYFGAVGNVAYTGTLTPNGTAYRLGGGGGVLTYNSVLGGSAYTVAIGGDVVLAGANTYNGVTTVNIGTLSVSSLADAGVNCNIGSYASAGAAGLVMNGGTLEYTGASTSLDRGFTLSSRSIIDVITDGVTLTLGASSLGAYTLSVTGGSGSRLDLPSVALTGAAKLEPSSADLSIGAVSGTYNLNLGGTATGNSATGVIAIGSAALTKSDSGTWTLSGSNTYSGKTILSKGTLVVSNLANAGTASAIGQSTSVAGNLLLGSGTTLKYMGAGDSSDRLFTFNGTAAGQQFTIDSSGSGPLKFTNTGSLAYGSANQTRTLVLLGSEAGSNTVSAAIADNGTGATSLTKNGSGTWILAGATKPYTGATTVNDGTLLINDCTLSSSAVTVSTGGTLGGTGTIGTSLTTASGTTLQPGAPTGTLTITGAATIDGTLAITLDSSGSTLAVGGTLDIEGASLEVTGSTTSTIRIIATYGSLTGTFGSNLVLPDGWVVNYAYEGNQIALTGPAGSVFRFR